MIIAMRRTARHATSVEGSESLRSHSFHLQTHLTQPGCFLFARATLCSNIFASDPVSANVFVFGFLQSYFGHEFCSPYYIMQIGICLEISTVSRQNVAFGWWVGFAQSAICAAHDGFPAGGASLACCLAAVFMGEMLTASFSLTTERRIWLLNVAEDCETASSRLFGT